MIILDISDAPDTTNEKLWVFFDCVGIYKNLSFSTEVFHVFAGKNTLTGTPVLAGLVLSHK